MKQIPEWMARLAADMLREYSERLTNDGCNAYDVPEWVPRDELVAAIEDWDGNDKDDPEKSEHLTGSNWCVAAAVAHALSPKGAAQ